MTMTKREFASAIRHSRRLMLYVDYSPDPDGAVWIQVTQTKAREILEAAKEQDVEEIVARMKGQDCYIGDPNDFPEGQDEDDDPPEPEDDDDPT